ncbi:MAG: hypothetical protein JNK82_42935 [Myxococcaceae bacterium]|nr:hypothetical protein [Myxococcaceae bacterium]
MAETALRERFGTAEEPAVSEVIKAGAAAGVIGGLAMAVFAMGATTLLGQGPFAVPQLIGATFRGPEALLSGWGVIAWGVLLHLVTSAAYGTLFATLVRRDTPRGIATLAGVAFALGIFVLMMFVVVPVVDPVMASRAAMMVGTMLVMHVLYGVGLGLSPYFRRVFTKRPDPVPRTPTRITISTGVR